MLLHLHVCTLPADKRVYQEHLKVTTNHALKIIQPVKTFSGQNSFSFTLVRFQTDILRMAFQIM